MPDPSIAASDPLAPAPPTGSRVAVFGGRGGLGRRLVESCLRLDHQVAVFDLPGTFDPAAQDAKVLTFEIDAADEQAVSSAMADLGRRWSGLDHLVFLVGFSTIPPVRIRELATSEWDRVIDGNLRAGYLAARHGLPLLDRGRDPSLVFVSSALTVAPQRGYGPYVAAKLGVTGLVKSLAIELAPTIRVNAVAPSAMLTPFLTGSSADPSKREWFDAGAAAAAVPLGRLCTPDDVVGPILFLASPAARFITGQTLHISGGRTLP